MGRPEEALRVANELLDNIELQQLNASEILLKASRVARLTGHDDLLTFITLERDGYETAAGMQAHAVWIDRAGRRSDAMHYYTAPLSKIEANVESSRETLKSLQGGGRYSGEWVTIAAREHDEKITATSGMLALMSAICKKVVATIYDLIVEIYHELLFSELQASLFSDTQTRVDGALAVASGSALDKIERVSDRLRDGDSESISQALTTCRRLIESCSNHLFPPTDVMYDPNGLNLQVGAQQTLNRLQAYAHSLGISKSRRDRLRLTLREIYSRCSAGTHSDVSVQEARFVFLQTYVVLGEMLTLGEAASGTAAAPLD